MSEARKGRFRAFLEATAEEERDWLAFVEFEQAAHRVADRACIVNQYGDPENNVRELETLETPAAQMLFRAVSRIGLGPLVANAEGIGVAIRFGLIDAKAEGLDGVADADALAALLEKGEEALDAHMAAVRKKHEKAPAGPRAKAHRKRRIK